MLAAAGAVSLVSCAGPAQRRPGPPEGAESRPQARSVVGPSEYDGETPATAGGKRLGPERRAALGLPLAQAPPGSLPPLSEAQWADPEAVAARFVVVDTTYAATEHPETVNARRNIYVTASVAARLSASSSGEARLEHLRRQGAVFFGEILRVEREAAPPGAAAITVAVRQSLLVGGVAQGAPRIGFYHLSLVGGPGGYWAVADVERS